MVHHRHLAEGMTGQMFRICPIGCAAPMTLPLQVRAHMLRHAAGYTLANAGKDTRSIQAYLGHRDIKHTVRYTQTDVSSEKD